MTVKELIELLQKEDPERLIIMSKDAEGNSFSPLSSVEACAYRPETTWYGESGIETLTQELKEAGFREEDVIVDGQKALCLWPVN